MRCPGCRADAISLAAKLRVAARGQARCPACGVQVKLSLWPRRVNTWVGELSVLAGFGLSLWLATPAPLVLSAAWWLTLGLALPLSSGHDREPPESQGD